MMKQRGGFLSQLYLNEFDPKYREARARKFDRILFTGLKIAKDVKDRVSESLKEHAAGIPARNSSRTYQ